MSYTVNWITKVVTVPTADLTLVSGTRYSLPMQDFLIEIRRLESEFADGLWADQMLDHSNKRVDFAGVDYAAFDEIINGYTIQFTGVATRIDLLGTNNNIIDYLIPTGISIVPNNSAGLQIVSVGSGLSVDEQDTLKLLEAVAVGKSIITDLGGGLATVKFRDKIDTKDVVTADMDGSERTSVTLDP